MSAGVTPFSYIRRTAPAARRGMMLGAVLLATSSLGVSPPPPPPPPGETLCAEIVPGSSNAYQQSPGDWHFSLTFKVHWWVPKMHISIAFGEPVQISQVTGGASQVFYGPGASSCLELPTVPSHTTPACRFFQWTRVPSWSSWTREFTTRILNLWCWARGPATRARKSRARALACSL